MNNIAENSSTSSLSFAETSDELLVVEAQGGNVFAFAELKRRHESRMRRLLYGITKNLDDTEDALQDCFFKVFLNLNKFEHRSSFSTCVTRVAINSGLMILRKRRRNKELATETINENERSGKRWEATDSGESIEACMVQRQEKELLRQAIQRLPPVYRTVIELRIRREYSMRQISDSLSISIQAAKSRLLRGQKALRISMSDLSMIDPGACPTQTRSQTKGTKPRVREEYRAAESTFPSQRRSYGG